MIKLKNEAYSQEEKEKDINELRNLMRREKEIRDFIMKYGFGASMKYRDEFHDITGKIGKLANKIDMDGGEMEVIYGNGILSKLSNEIGE